MNEPAKKADNVIPMKDGLDVKTIPAYISTLTMELGNGRRLNLQTPFAHDENVQDALGRILKAADFHRAKYEIDELDDELHKAELQHADFENHFERVKDNHDLDNLRQEGEAQKQLHSASGRKGDVKMPANYLQRLQGAERAHAANVKQGEFQLRKSQIQIDKIKREIEKRRKIVTEG